MPAGRPSKLTSELQKQICDFLVAGNFAETVCDFVGIDKTTYYEWLKRGERGWQIDIEGGYVEFSHAVKKAVAQVEMTTVHGLRKRPYNWQADAWWLERRHPDRWGNRQKHVHSGDGDEGEITIRVKYGDEGNNRPSADAPPKTE